MQIYEFYALSVKTYPIKSIKSFTKNKLIFFQIHSFRTSINIVIIIYKKYLNWKYLNTVYQTQEKKSNY